MVFLLPLTFPVLEAAAFFSTSDVQPPEQLDFLKLYIPSNPFRTLADGILPGVVVFGIAVGVALISVKRKESLLDQIRERGTLRAGYIRDSLPYTFFNSNDELVGFDVEMAGELASDLGVKLEFVPYGRQTLLQQLEAGHFDIAVGGRDATPTLAADALLSRPYLDVNLGIVVEDFRRKEFDTVEKIRDQPNLRLGALDGDYLGPRLKKKLPQAEIVTLVNPPEFFEGGFLEVDGLVISVQAGSAWTLLNPEFTAVAPQPVAGTIPLAYVIAWRDSELKAYLDSWIELKKGDGSIDRLYAHWILGEDAGKGEPRWSVIRNVLGWVD